MSKPISIPFVSAGLPEGTAIVCNAELAAIFTRHVSPTEKDLEDARRLIQQNPKAVALIVGMRETR